LTDGKKIYFVSDAHLGAPGALSSHERERLLVEWLEMAAKDAEEIYLMGDIFDFWFEFKRLVPRGFTRFLGTLAKITDSGIRVYYFTGNHDMWIFDYLPSETGIVLLREPLIKQIGGKTFYLAHGDGLGPFDKKYKILKSIFNSRFCQWWFKRLHPSFSFWIAHTWSTNSRKKHRLPEKPDFEKEWLVQYSRSVLEQQHIDYFIFGHRHICYQYPLNKKSRLINLGDWLINFSYAVFDGFDVEQKKYPKP